MKSPMFLLGWMRRIRIFAALTASSLLLASGACAEAIFQVNDTADDVDANVLDGKCETPLPAKKCTLRAAVMQANRMPTGATINLPAGTYELTIPASIEDGEENGDLNMIVPAGYNPGSTHIVGAGADSTTIDAKGGSRILKIDSNRTALISGVALINGVANSGGGIYTTGSLQLTRTQMAHNAASDYGGGIYALSGTLNLAYSVMDSNSAVQGGGIYLSNDATVTVDHTTLSRNIAAYGGALKSNGVLAVSNSTISQNHGNVGGGGIYSVGNTNVFNSTIAYNQTQTDTAMSDEDGGAGILVISFSTVNLHNSILAGNRLVLDNSHSDCVGVIGLYGVNGIEGADQCIGFGAVIIVDSATELGVLKNNGGPSETIALLPPSLLIGNGLADECKDNAGQYLTSDQRGNPRPPAGTTCDIGAFEYNELFRSSFDLLAP